jgi:hypothetical protein
MRFSKQNGVFCLMVVGMALALALAPALVSAQIPRADRKQIAFHEIEAFLKDDGSATAEEQFFFSFLADEAEQFETDFEENTPSLFEWKKDYPFIHPYLGTEARVENIEFLLNRSANLEPTLRLSYDYPEGLIQQIKVGTEGRSTRWKLSEIALVQFIAGGNINIPSNTQIKIHFPNNAIIDTRLLPQGISVSGNTITITNFQSNSLPIEYTLLTPIADPIDAGKILENALQSPWFALVIVLLSIVGVYAALNRERLAGKIEDYVIEHSEFRPQPKQDIDADLEGEEGP